MVPQGAPCRNREISGKAFFHRNLPPNKRWRIREGFGLLRGLASSLRLACGCALTWSNSFLREELPLPVLGGGDQHPKRRRAITRLSVKFVWRPWLRGRERDLSRGRVHEPICRGVNVAGQRECRPRYCHAFRRRRLSSRPKFRS